MRLNGQIAARLIFDLHMYQPKASIARISAAISQSRTRARAAQRQW